MTEPEGLVITVGPSGYYTDWNAIAKLALTVLVFAILVKGVKR